MGDTLSLSVRYFMPLQANLETLENFRIFLNGSIPKKHCVFILEHRKIVKINLKFENIDEPKISESGKKIRYQWEAWELTGCINEPNSRAYLQLPYISFCANPEDFTYTIPNSYDMREYQLNALCALTREYDFLEVRRSVKIGVQNKNYSKLYRYVKQFEDSISSDSTGIKLIDAVHNDVTNNFIYLDSKDSYNGSGTSLHHFWKMVRDKEIPDRSRIAFYMAIIGHTNHFMYTGYIADKRSGVISENYIAPMLTDDFCLVPVFNDNTMHTFWPKRDAMTLYRNELPFYFESTTMALMHPEDFIFNKTELTHELRVTSTPSSDLKHNLRKHTALVKIDLDSGIAKAECKINLSGQFSTLTRSLYKGNVSYSQVNESYNRTVLDTWNSDKVRMNEITTKPQFPFASKIAVAGDLSHLMQVEDGKIEFTLKGLINHIITELDDKRSLDYYFDFLGSDSYTYMLQFDDSVKLDNPTSITIDHDEIRYIFEVSQVSPNAVRVVSKQKTLLEKVAAKEYDKVREVFETIQLIENFKVKLSQEKI